MFRIKNIKIKGLDFFKILIINWNPSRAKMGGILKLFLEKDFVIFFSYNILLFEGKFKAFDLSAI